MNILFSFGIVILLFPYLLVVRFQIILVFCSSQDSPLISSEQQVVLSEKKEKIFDLCQAPGITGEKSFVEKGK